MKSSRQLLYLCITMLIACQSGQNSASVENPPAPGFDIENSDPAAVELADSIMTAMGGRVAWDNTRFISWTFMERRDHAWDKALGRVRIESFADSTVYLINVNTAEGRVRVAGKELTEPELLQKKVQEGIAYWINDAYWLVMPFKLKDTGVTLTYLGEDTLMTGGKCNVLQLTFKNVGVTPQNRYLVYVDLADNLVKQWAYFREATQDSADFVRLWDNYKRYGDILLSADRSDGKGPTNVKIDEHLPDEVFTRF